MLEFYSVLLKSNNSIKVEGVFDHNETIKSLDGIENFGGYSSDLFKMHQQLLQLVIINSEKQ